MAEMTSKEIIKVVDKFIGTTTAIGESNADEEIDENLRKMIDLTNYLLDGIADSARTRHRPEYSMRRTGERAFSAMCKWKDWLDTAINMD